MEVGFKPTLDSSHRIHSADVLADYLLEKNPATGTKIIVDVEGKELKISN